MTSQKNKHKIKVAVIGSGLTGLCTANHLIDLGYRVDIYSDRHPHETTSSLISGLCYPFSGPTARPHKYAFTALDATKTYAKKMLKPADIQHIDIHRHAKDDVQAEHFHSIAKQYDYLRIETTYDNKTTLTIPHVMYINMKRYISSMVSRLQTYDVNFINKSVTSIKDCGSYSLYIICAGAYSDKIMELSNLKTETIPGHCMALPNDSINTNDVQITKHILIPNTFDQECYVGGTYEKNPSKSSKQYLLDMLLQFPEQFTHDDFSKIISKRLGLRGYLPGKLPGIHRASPNVYAVLGMGSKGLMYHVWMTQLLMKYIETGSPNHIPNDYLVKKQWLVSK